MLEFVFAVPRIDDLGLSYISPLFASYSSATMKSFVLAFALTCLIGAATGLEGDARDLSGDCSKILEWKLYYPGDVTYFPVNEKEVPGNMKRIKNGTCVEVSETEHFNFMMYTLDWGPGCGETQPECGSFKLYYIDEAKIIQRSGKEVGTCSRQTPSTWR